MVFLFIFLHFLGVQTVAGWEFTLNYTVFLGVKASGCDGGIRDSGLDESFWVCSKSSEGLGS